MKQISYTSPFSMHSAQSPSTRMCNSSTPPMLQYAHKLGGIHDWMTTQHQSSNQPTPCTNNINLMGLWNLTSTNWRGPMPPPRRCSISTSTALIALTRDPIMWQNKYQENDWHGRHLQCGVSGIFQSC